VLYGETALALRLGHRESVDFDFFSSRLFQPIELIRSIPYLAGAEITQEEANLPEPFPAAMKADLLAAVKSVSLQNLPTITATQRIGAGVVRA